jgi:hypothetical protein
MKFILDLFFQNLSIKIFYRNNLNQKINNIIKTNRSFLDSVEQFLPEEEYQLNDYGIQKRIYNQMDKNISDLPTYSDFIVFLITNVFSRKDINYLEIGVSVLKNFLQVNSGVQNVNLVAYDINNINPTFKNLSSYSVNGNKLRYFQGSVLSKNDAEKFKKDFPDKFDFIFSDALHTPEGIRSEYDLIIKDSLAKNFLIYYDDLDFVGLEEEFLRIKADISKARNQQINFYTFLIYGWIGNNEKLHKNGIITNINIESVMNNENLKIYKFKKMNQT